MFYFTTTNFLRKYNNQQLLQKGTNKMKIKIGKREEYINAWREMYKRNKKGFNMEMFDGVNPALNKTPLKTEIDNVAAVAYLNDENGVEIPVGIFSFVLTNSKIIGKQFVVDPEYQGNGIGKALVLSLEQELKDMGHEVYYIGCSKMSAGIMKSFGSIPYSEDFEHDMFKFNVDLNRSNFSEQYKKHITDRNVEIEK